MTREELIGALETATGPDRELDAQLAIAAGDVPDAEHLLILAEAIRDPLRQDFIRLADDIAALAPTRAA
jgi:hypothetical protein